MVFKLLVCYTRKAIDRKEKEACWVIYLKFYYLAKGMGP